MSLPEALFTRYFTVALQGALMAVLVICLRAAAKRPSGAAGAGAGAGQPVPEGRSRLLGGCAGQSAACRRENAGCRTGHFSI